SLVERLATKLNQEGMGILALRCELEAAGSPGQPISPDGPFSEGRGSCRAGTLDAPATGRAAPPERRPPVEHLYVVGYRVRLLRPTVDARHVMSLLRLQWERRSLPEGITRIRIVISERAPLQVIEQTLWNMGDRQTSQDAAALLEKLTSRLG